MPVRHVGRNWGINVRICRKFGFQGTFSVEPNSESRASEFTAAHQFEAARLALSEVACDETLTKAIAVWSEQSRVDVPVNVQVERLDRAVPH